MHFKVLLGCYNCLGCPGKGHMRGKREWMQLTGSSVKNLIVSHHLVKTGICKNVRKKYQALLRGIYATYVGKDLAIPGYLAERQKQRRKRINPKRLSWSSDREFPKYCNVDFLSLPKYIWSRLFCWNRRY